MATPRKKAGPKPRTKRRAATKPRLVNKPLPNPIEERERRKAELGICGKPPLHMDLRSADGRVVQYRIPRALQRR